MEDGMAFRVLTEQDNKTRIGCAQLLPLYIQPSTIQHACISPKTSPVIILEYQTPSAGGNFVESSGDYCGCICTALHYNLTHDLFMHAPTTVLG